MLEQIDLAIAHIDRTLKGRHSNKGVHHHRIGKSRELLYQIELGRRGLVGYIDCLRIRMPLYETAVKSAPRHSISPAVAVVNHRDEQHSLLARKLQRQHVSFVPHQGYRRFDYLLGGLLISRTAEHPIELSDIDKTIPIEA